MKSLIFRVLFVVAAALAGCVAETQGEGEDPVKVGDRVPAFTVAGGAEGTMDARFGQGDFEGRRSMIVFFSSDCPDCRRELPVVHEAWLALRGRDDFQLIAVARQPSAARVAEYWSSAEGGKPSFEGMPWWHDAYGAAFRAFAANRVPRLYLVDTRGRVAGILVETFDMSAGDLVRLVDGLD